jgi:EEF1A lysine methyltransferase 4
MPPSYGTQAYWDERFTKENHFEWLLPPDALTAPIRSALERSNKQETAAGAAHSRILHIGCGSSDLSFHLRGLVDRAEQVVNVDYSEVAIRKCVEHEAWRNDCNRNGGGTMVWRTVDLLSPDSVAILSRPATNGDDEESPGFFDVIADKSTSDCIACTDDVKVELPYRLPLRAAAERSEPEKPVVKCAVHHVHPLHVIAVHLAALARPGSTRWLCLSYSNDRFSFLESGCSSSSNSRNSDSLVPDGFPDPRALWRIETKQEMVVAEEEEQPVDDTRPYVHRPSTVHWLYTLVRTEQPL